MQNCECVVVEKLVENEHHGWILPLVIAAAPPKVAARDRQAPNRQPTKGPVPRQVGICAGQTSMDRRKRLLARRIGRPQS